MDPWLDGLWQAIKGALSKMASDRTAYLKGDAGDSVKETPDVSVPDVGLSLLSLADCQNGEPLSKPASAASSSAPATQTAVSDARPASPAGSPALASPSQGAASVSTSVAETRSEDAASLTHSLPPLSQSSLNVPALPPPFLDVTLQEIDSTEQVINDTEDKSYIIYIILD